MGRRREAQLAVPECEPVLRVELANVEALVEEVAVALAGKCAHQRAQRRDPAGRHPQRQLLVAVLAPVLDRIPQRDEVEEVVGVHVADHDRIEAVVTTIQALRIISGAR